MKTFLTFILCLLGSANTYADCKQSGLFLFPKGNTIRQNPVFVLNGFGFSEHTIEGLNKEYPIYLQSGDIKVPLIVREMNKGQFELTQAVLVPSETLVAGLEYTMHIDHKPSYENFSYHSSNAVFRVLPGLDTIKPFMTAQVKETRKILQHFGCGPSAFVVFNCPVKDSSEMMVKATVKNLKTGISSSYYIETDGLELRLGHNMCYGAFKFNDGNKYEVRMEFMDASGNSTAMEDPIRFSKPTQESDPMED